MVELVLRKTPLKWNARPVQVACRGNINRAANNLSQLNLCEPALRGRRGKEKGGERGEGEGVRIWEEVEGFRRRWEEVGWDRLCLE